MDSAPALFLQAQALIKEGNPPHCLVQAQEVLEKAIALDPLYVEAWLQLANVLIQLGLFFSESHYFQEASFKFERVDKIASERQDDFFWNWGFCHLLLGKESGEAVDYRKALDLFARAEGAGCQGTRFYWDYANAFVELSILINHPEYLVKAIDYYNKAIKIDPNYGDAWFDLALAQQQLYLLTGKKEDFNAAHESFEHATLYHSDALLWLKWGSLCLYFGRNTQNVEKLQMACDKFSKGISCKPDDPVLLSYWAEALVLLGSQEENLEFLRQGESKILKSLDLLPDSPHSWYIYGICQYELGRYFGDKDFYFEAIATFQHGLSIDRNEPLLWYGLAVANFTIGEIIHSPEFLEKSLRYFAHVANYDPPPPPHIWNDWGVALMKLGEITEEVQHVRSALEKFEHALQRGQEHDPDFINPDWLYNYGCTLDFLGDLEDESAYYDQAAQVLIRVLELDPHYAHAHFNLAMALAHLAEHTSDVETFERAIDCFHGVLDSNSEDEMAWNELGLTYMHLALLVRDPVHPESAHHYFEQAESKLKHAAALGYNPSLYNLACLYSLCGNQTLAMHYIERAERQNGLPMLDDLLNDEWLEGLHQSPVFRNFITHLAAKQGRGELR